MEARITNNTTTPSSSSSSSSSSQPQPITLITLPLEIRNIIYDILLTSPYTSPPRHILNHTCDTWRKHPVSDKLVKGPFDGTKVPYPSIWGLRNCCRQVHDEVDGMIRFMNMQTRFSDDNGKIMDDGIWAGLDILIGTVCNNQQIVGLPQCAQLFEQDRPQSGIEAEMEAAYETNKLNPITLQSTWTLLPIPLTSINNIHIDIRLQSYTQGLFTSTSNNDSEQVSGTIIRYFFELFSGLLSTDGVSRIQPERCWNILEINLVVDDDDDHEQQQQQESQEYLQADNGVANDVEFELEFDNNGDNDGDDYIHRSTTGRDNDDNAISYRARRQRIKRRRVTRWQKDAGNELRFLLDIIGESGILHGRLNTLRFFDGVSKVEWDIHKMNPIAQEENVHMFGFRDLSKVWLGLECGEMV